MNRRVWKVTLVSGQFGVKEIWVAVKCSIVKCRMYVFDSKTWRGMVEDLWWLVYIHMIKCSTSHPAEVVYLLSKVIEVTV
jgi:hypothetical protein